MSDNTSSANSSRRHKFIRLGQSLRRPFTLRPLALLGPGIIAAVSGDDAGGIATYSTIGARYQYEFLWLLVVLAPTLSVIQVISTRLGIVTGKGLTALIREQFDLRSAMVGILALFLSNSITAVSEFIGIAAALELFHVPRFIGVPIAAVIVWWLIIRGTYQRVEKLFLVLSALFLSYVVASFLAGPDWLSVGWALIPTFRFEADYLALFIATIATSITPYMQVYAQSSVVEKGLALKDLTIAQLDAIAGSIFSIAIAIFIVITTGATLYPHGIQVKTAAEAAHALVPLAGDNASLLFGLGFLGASMLAAGVLPLTTAFSTCEAFGWRSGVQYSYKQAPIFYTIFTFLILMGVVLTVLPNVPLIPLLILAYIINGIFLPIELYYLLKLANDRELMGNYRNGIVLNWFASIIFCIISVAVFFLIISFIPLAPLFAFFGLRY